MADTTVIYIKYFIKKEEFFVNKSVKKLFQRFLGNFIAVVMLVTSVLTGNMAVFAADEGSAQADATKPTVWILGDSTVCGYKDGKNTAEWDYRQGWGERLGDYFKDGSVNVMNIARSGRSSRDFQVYVDGNDTKDLPGAPNPYNAFKSGIKQGDYVIIQFGHNDEKSPIGYQKKNDVYGYYLDGNYPKTDAEGGIATVAGLKDWKNADANGYVTIPNLPTKVTFTGENVGTIDNLKDVKNSTITKTGKCEIDLTGTAFANGKVPSFEAILYNKYVKVAQDAGATPILVKPVIRANSDWKTADQGGHHSVKWRGFTRADSGVTYDFPAALQTADYFGTTNDGKSYCDAIQAVADEAHIPVIDLCGQSAIDWPAYASANGGDFKALHAKDKANSTNKDKTHLSRLGAFKAAGIVAEAIKTAAPTLAANLKETFPTEPLDNVGGGSTEPDTSEPDSGEPDTGGGNEPDTGSADKDDRGEIDGDEGVNYNDASVLLNYVLSKNKEGIAADYSDEMLMYMGDVNSDGIISAADVSEILKKAIDDTFEFTGAKGEKPAEGESQDESESSSGGSSTDTGVAVSGTAKNADKVEFVGEETTYSADPAADGKFSVAGVKEGTYTIKVTPKANYKVTNIEGTGVSKVSNDYKLEVGKTAIEDIAVTLQETGSTPTTKHTVTITGQNLDSTSKFNNQALTFTGDTATVENVEDGKYDLVLVPTTGKKIKSVKVDGTAVTAKSGDTYEITVNGADVAVAVETEDSGSTVTTHKVTINGANLANTSKFDNTALAFASDSAEVTEVADGEHTLELAAAEGYKIKSVKVGETALTAENGKYKINVSGADVTVTVETEVDGGGSTPATKYTVSITGENLVNGTADGGSKFNNAAVTFDDSTHKFTSEELVAGDYVFKPVAAEGYKITAVKVDGQEVNGNNGEYTITVGSANVVVTVETVQVVKVSGTAANATKVILTKDGDSEVTTEATVDSTNGNKFEFTDLPVGNYIVSALGNGFVYTSAKVGEQGTDLADNKLKVLAAGVENLIITMTENTNAIEVSGVRDENVAKVEFYVSENDITSLAAEAETTEGTSGSEKTYGFKAKLTKNKTYVIKTEHKTGYELNEIKGTTTKVTDDTFELKEAPISDLSITSRKNSAKVSGTAAAGVKSVTLTKKAAPANVVLAVTDVVTKEGADPVTYTATVEESSGKYTFAFKKDGTEIEIPNGNYTISADVELNYQDATIKVGESAATEIEVKGTEINNIAVSAEKKTDLVTISGAANKDLKTITFTLTKLGDADVPAGKSFSKVVTVAAGDNNDYAYTLKDMLKGTYKITVEKNQGVTNKVQYQIDSAEAVEVTDEGAELKVANKVEKLNFATVEDEKANISGKVKFEYTPDEAMTVVVKAKNTEKNSEVTTSIDVEAASAVSGVEYVLKGDSDAALVDGDWTITAEVKSKSTKAASNREFMFKEVQQDATKVDKVNITGGKAAMADVVVGEIVLAPYGEDFDGDTVVEPTTGKDNSTNQYEVATATEANNNKYLKLDYKSGTAKDSVYANYDLKSFVPADAPVKFESNSQVVVSFDVKLELTTEGTTITFPNENNKIGNTVFELVGELASTPKMSSKLEETENPKRYAALREKEGWYQLDLQDNSIKEIAEFGDLKFLKEESGDTKTYSVNDKTTNKWYNVTYVIDYETGWLTGTYKCGDTVFALAPTIITKANEVNKRGITDSNVKVFSGCKFNKSSMKLADGLNLTIFPVKNKSVWGLDNIKVYVKGWRTGDGEYASPIPEVLNTISEKYLGKSYSIGGTATETSSADVTVKLSKVKAVEGSNDEEVEVSSVTVKADGNTKFGFDNVLEPGTYVLSVENKKVSVASPGTGVTNDDANGKVKVEITDTSVLNIALKVEEKSTSGGGTSTGSGGVELGSLDQSAAPSAIDESSNTDEPVISEENNNNQPTEEAVLSEENENAPAVEDEEEAPEEAPAETPEEAPAESGEETPAEDGVNEPSEAEAEEPVEV